MSRLVYACRFEIVGKNSENLAIDAYLDWLTEHYQKRYHQPLAIPGKGDFSAADLPPRHILNIRRHEALPSRVDQLDWTIPSETDSTLTWRNEVRIGRFSESCSVEHAIYVDSTEYLIAPARLSIGSPSVVRRLCASQSVHVGEMQIKATPYQLDESGVSAFLKLLTSDLRKLPIVFLSPFSRGDRNNLIGQTLARKLAGVAVVVEALEPQATWDVADELGRTLACFNGGARIYWPLFKASDDPRQHPLYLANRIQSWGEAAVGRSIERTIFAVASFRYVPDVKISDVVRRSEQAQRAIQLQANKESSKTDWEAYALELDADLARTKSQLAGIEAENNNLRANQKLLFARYAEEGTEDVQPEEISVPDTVIAAVKKAKEESRNLVVLDDALDAAESCPFRRPEEVLAALRDLDSVAAAWAEARRDKGSGGDVRQHLIDRGWGKRCSMHISDTTRKKYKSDYSFTYEGASRLFEPHITLGSGDANSCASISCPTKKSQRSWWPTSGNICPILRLEGPRSC